MLLPFTKAHGTGNNFIILYLPECPNIDLNKTIIQKLCHNNFGIGADGLITINQHHEYDYKLDYYNNDGTWETMCANGARCAGMLMYNKIIIIKQSSFIAGDGEHKLNILDDANVAITVFPPHYTSDEIHVENLSGFSINSGAKHFVVEINHDNNLDLESIGRKIRCSQHFPNGTNVNFTQHLDNNILRVITYEKGVEKIMQSCGTGSVAAAYHMQKKYDLDYNLNVEVPGGTLFISTDDEWQNVWLKGEAKLLFNAKINTEKL